MVAQAEDVPIAGSPRVVVTSKYAPVNTLRPGHSPPSGISLLDGRVWANNPVRLAIVEAVGVLDWPPRRPVRHDLGSYVKDLKEVGHRSYCDCRPTITLAL